MSDGDEAPGLSPGGGVDTNNAGKDSPAPSEGGPSLVFSGGGDFLSKYQHLRKDNGPVRQRKKGNDASTRDGLGPDRENVQLNSLIVQATNVDRVLQVVALRLEQFNAVNLITALHRMATLVAAPRRAGLRRDSRFKKLVSRTLDLLQSTENGNLKPQDLSNAAWALTKLGLLNATLFNLLAEHSRCSIGTFEPVNLSMTLWAFARAGFLEEKLFKAAACEVKRQIRSFQPQQIANTTWAMAKSRFIDEELFMLAAEFSLEQIGDFQPMNYSMLLYSFALAKLRHEKLFLEVARRCTARALIGEASAPHVITNLALAFSEAGVSQTAIFDQIAEAAQVTLAEFRTQQIATLVQAYAGADVKHRKLFDAITTGVVPRIAEFRHQDLQDLLAAYEALGMPATAISKAVRQQEEAEQGLSKAWPVNMTLLLAIFCVITLLWRISDLLT
mmetsp:Transcript_23692/g.55264  ORF Transcript_23692/g.55264 Transcript_23692/m.55264 type:complete len:445 (-) Transcript_23692:42-1376(-)